MIPRFSHGYDSSEAEESVDNVDMSRDIYRPSSALTLTISEVQEELRLSRSRICELIRSGELPSVKIGRSRRVPRKSIESFLARLLDEQGHQ